MRALYLSGFEQPAGRAFFSIMLVLKSPTIEQGNTPQKEKQSAYASALLWSSPDTVFFPCGSLIFWIEPGPKRCTRIRELINVL
jgi:hypothetical protein